MAPTDPLSRTFAALADPTRRAMLARLAQGPASVSELAEPFNIRLRGRLQAPAGAGERGAGQARPGCPGARQAALNARPLQAASAWLGEYRVFWAESLDALGAVLDGLAESGAAAPAEATSPEARKPGTHNKEDS